MAQAVPNPFPLGEIEYGLTIIPFTASDILAVERFQVSGFPALKVELDPRLDPLIAEATREPKSWSIKLNLCGRQMIDARIQDPLIAAAFIVTFPDAAQADAVAETFRHPPCAPAMS
ncbi:MAG: hypothetical protein JNK34_01780 [Tabrizicola sp.]|nr:hypothetical protein [Tabrizicola sp.]